MNPKVDESSSMN